MPEKYAAILRELYRSYRRAVGQSFVSASATWRLFFELIEEELEHPYTFAPYHQKVRSPIDYYQFGIDFLLPLVDLPRSHVLGLNVVDEIALRLSEGANVILFANHQTEPDPQAIAILLQRTHPKLAEKIIYVAGERVISDLMAIPFSMGCDLLCIYSKRYIDHPPELKAQKQLHNKQTMEKMSRLLQEGGKIIYVAPSGGRDRRNFEGVVEVAPFDPDSIEMFYLMARKAKTPTYFHPLAVATYNILPPPETIQKELGESRSTKRTPIHLFFGPAFDMEHFTGSEESDRLKRRKMRGDAIWSLVKQQYQTLDALS
ncbi:MAG: 1-acyl-sn-glycerol-3-phosphate acyltransferase [Chlamydiia bacterium]|nr:1-acyl-sn-glycerol-3-phosphate acyltransferase [Chlamydiia bacterium]